MKMMYFFTAYATFASIAVAQAASFMVTQKLEERVSSSNFSDAQMRNPLGEVLQEKFSSLGNNQQESAVQLVSVASSVKKKVKSGKKGGGRRPSLFRQSPMSF